VLGVRLYRGSGVLELSRPERSNIATLTQPGQPDRRVALAHRKDDECVAEELRRLDPDEVYGAALTKGLAALDPATYAKEAAR
jgi:glucose-6-phosphate dehydrogenase assembly protein OpcA